VGEVKRLLIVVFRTQAFWLHSDNTTILRS
jgi:hypothetical protein